MFRIVTPVANPDWTLRISTLVGMTSLSTRAGSKAVRTVASIGGVAAASLAGPLMLAGQVLYARHQMQTPDGFPLPVFAGLYGKPGRAPLNVAVLGDSLAAGFGSNDPQRTIGAALATALTDLTDRPVEVHSAARVGARSADLSGQLSSIQQSCTTHVDLALIVVGANDVTHFVPAPVAARQLSSVVQDMSSNGTKVVVVACPDLGVIKYIPQPLHFLAATWSMRVAEAQLRAAKSSGGCGIKTSSDLTGLVSGLPGFFSADNFHPSSDGYHAINQELVPAALEAVGLLQQQPPIGSLPKT